MAHRYFFAYCVFTICQVTGQSTKYALLGHDVNFVTAIKTAPDEILWKHNGNKMVEFNGQIQKQYDSFKGRVTLDWHSANVHITDLRYEDSGRYDLEIYTKNILESSQYDLEIIDCVAKPTISCEMNDGGSSGKTGGGATLMCSAESKQSQSLLEFEWSSDGNKQVGPKLIIPLGDVHDKQVYNCTVSNPLTKESATFTAKECYSDKSLSTPGIIGICVASLILILISIVVIYKLCKVLGKCECTTKRDVEKQSDQDTAAGSNEDHEEKRVLLDRAPTMPSHQSLEHLNQKSTHNGLEVKRIESSTSSSSGKCHDLPTNEQADENKSGETGNKDPEPDPAHSKTSDNSLEENGAKRKSMSSAVAEKSEHIGEATRTFTQKENEMKLKAAVQRKFSESEPAASEDDVNLPDCDKQTAGLEDKRKSTASPVPEKSEHVGEVSRTLTAKETGVTPSAAVEGKASESEASAEADVTLPGCDKQSSEVKRIESSASSSSGNDLPTNEQADENKSGETGNKDPEPDPAHSKTSDNDSEKKKIDSSLSTPSGTPSHTHPTKKEAPEDEPGETGVDPAESGTGDPGEKENVATSEDDAQSQKSEAKPCSHLGSEKPPETNGETSSDQAAGVVPQPPLTTTNPAEETLQGGNQAPEAKTPDGHGKLDHPPNTSVMARSSSESVNSNTETSLKPPDAEKTDPDPNEETSL